MIKKIAYTICLIIISMVILSSCNSVVPPIETQLPTDTASPDPTLVPSPTLSSEPSNTAEQLPSELQNLFPGNEGFTWIYNGFVEYGHEMTITSIAVNPDDVTYEIIGMVYDASGGEADRDFTMSLKYIMDDEVILQEKSGEMFMETQFDEIELVRLPLDLGATWEQTIQNIDGESITLQCTIEEIDENNGQKTYTIVYQDTSSDYFEKRVIQEGIGVVSFEKLYISDTDEPFVMGYYLFLNQE